jgi:ATP-dependent RNA helicase DDX51/DBP6
MFFQVSSAPSLPDEFAPPTSPLQKLLFSATMTQNPEHFALLQLRRPKLFSVSDTMQLRGADASELTFGLPEQLVEKRVRCDLKNKPLALVHLVKGCGDGRSLEDMRKVLCFTNSKESTHR